MKRAQELAARLDALDRGCNDIKRFNKSLRADIDSYSRHTLVSAVLSSHHLSEDSASSAPSASSPPPSSSTSSGTSASALEEDKVFRAGWMYKEGARVKSWKRRFFILYGTTIEYYKKPDDSKPQGIIKLNTCTISPQQSRDGVEKPCMELSFGQNQRKWHFTAERLSDNVRWYTAIKNRVAVLAYVTRCGYIRASPNERVLQFLNHVPSLRRIARAAEFADAEGKGKGKGKGKNKSKGGCGSTQSPTHAFQAATPEYWSPSIPLDLSKSELSLDTVRVVQNVLSDCTICPGGGVSELVLTESNVQPWQMEALMFAVAKSDFNVAPEVDDQPKQGSLRKLKSGVGSNLSLRGANMYKPSSMHGVRLIDLSKTVLVEQTEAEEEAEIAQSKAKRARDEAMEEVLEKTLPESDDDEGDDDEEEDDFETNPLFQSTIKDDPDDIVSVKPVRSESSYHLTQKAANPMGAIVAMLRANTCLTTLKLNYCNISNRAAAILAVGLSGRSCPLSELELRGNRIGDPGATALAVHIAKGCERSKETERSYLPRFGLERLDLAENCIGDEGAKALAFCLKTPQLALVTLELSENDIGEAGAESLAESLDVNDKLRFLGLARNSAMAEHGSGARAILHAVHQQDSQVRQVSLLDAQVGGSSLNAMRLLSRFGFADAQRQAEATEHAA